MASVKLITRRIKSSKNIAQITRAMEMVAASRMKKAQDAALRNRAYADKILQATRELSAKTEKTLHPLLSSGNPKGKSLIIVISSNKGLAGGLFSNLFREVDVLFPHNIQADYITVGKKGESFVLHSGRKLLADFSSLSPFTESVPPITKALVEGFLNGTYKDVYVVYSSFINALRQIPAKKQILPLTGFEDQKDESSHFANFTIEPDVETVLESLLPHYLENQIRAAIYDAEASEHSARMVAMKNATDAALDLMDELTLIYNKIRQEKITYEIADTVTARMALE
ncbi:ATP synthase F1 subunit gamma [Candidatus Gottesmanbacteria bacterium RIFCSPHIGHO2_01_FULL_39_10]|uniref:ATP synthase gamma chain n=1 Tax=Candidatus Gottesmanbacteria bacterium RIFCSPHIGHO2_01_FULL_39_10 TaxID=1798375 RepID=A0A1F5ZKJ6_9BACT|nr:MAG: ATP synthase F1 subunit gamma [Candidatus Gottesmanbacteria bacterium RIFCSPHIGHO2_01_FULL_39_10]